MFLFHYLIPCYFPWYVLCIEDMTHIALAMVTGIGVLAVTAQAVVVVTASTAPDAVVVTAMDIEVPATAGLVVETDIAVSTNALAAPMGTAYR